MGILQLALTPMRIAAHSKYLHRNIPSGMCVGLIFFTDLGYGAFMHSVYCRSGDNSFMKFAFLHSTGTVQMVIEVCQSDATPERYGKSEIEAKTLHTGCRRAGYDHLSDGSIH